MMRVKNLLHIGNVEDFFGHKGIFTIVILLFLSFLSAGDLEMRIMAHLLALCWVSVSVSQLFNLFDRKKCEYLFCESPITENVRLFVFLKASLFDNSIIGIFLFLHLIVAMHASVLNSIIITGIHFAYAITFGMFCGKLHHRILGLLMIVLFYLFGLSGGSWWTTDEQLRFISTTLQLYNVDRIHLTNTFALILITVTLFLLSICSFAVFRRHRTIKTIGIISLGVGLISGVTEYELTVNERMITSEYETMTVDQALVNYRGIDRQSAEIFACMLSGVEDEIIKCGIGSRSREYLFTRYYVSSPLSFIYKTRPIPVRKVGESFYINVFSDAMINLGEPSLCYDIMERIYTQHSNNEEYIENEAIFRFVEGCREQVLKAVCEKSEYPEIQELADRYSKLIEYRIEMETNRYNLTDKIVAVLFEKYPEELPKLYTILKRELPKNPEDLLVILEEDLPKVFVDNEVQNIVKSIHGSK